MEGRDEACPASRLTKRGKCGCATLSFRALLAEILEEDLRRNQTDNVRNHLSAILVRGEAPAPPHARSAQLTDGRCSRGALWAAEQTTLWAAAPSGRPVRCASVTEQVDQLIALATDPGIQARSWRGLALWL